MSILPLKNVRNIICACTSAEQCLAVLFLRQKLHKGVSCIYLINLMLLKKKEISAASPRLQQGLLHS